MKLEEAESKIDELSDRIDQVKNLFINYLILELKERDNLKKKEKC